MYALNGLSNTVVDIATQECKTSSSSSGGGRLSRSVASSRMDVVVWIQRM